MNYGLNEKITINGIELVRTVIGSNEYILPLRYVAKELIGFGSFGSVVEAIDTKLNRSVAIKKIQNINDHIDLKRVIREIVILKNVKHENIIGLLVVFFLKK